ncbi:hypothetical protein [Cohnella rhizosphaerae]|uniref:Uncharacterized protein n=1 Tax=Cohnella rhizosphaerae TaxID=1457232 RepID=A0A9X4KU93_9BACL|nr:hypothetical protein [Cohnella rhizosphaerae]MDG0808959.1 hypothetical protein [Cohnella rhizosphaerae]
MANENPSKAGQEPMIKLQPNGVAPVLSYNVPEPTAYSGRNFIDLQLHDGYFLPTAARSGLQREGLLAAATACVRGAGAFLRGAASGEAAFGRADDDALRQSDAGGGRAPGSGGPQV